MPPARLLAAALFLPALCAAYEPDANAPRSAVPEKYRWDLSPILKDDQAWEKALADVRAKTAAISVHRGRLSSPAAIRACLDEYFVLRGALDHVASYANLKAVEDDGVGAYREMLQRALAAGAEFRSGTSFIRQELLRLDDASFGKLLADPSLAPYKAYIADLGRRRKALLDPEAERVLGLAGDNLWSEVDLNEIPSDVELIFKAFAKDVRLPVIKDEEGKEVQLTLSNYPRYRASKDRRVRLETVDSFFKALKGYEDIQAATLAAEAKRDVMMARARGYDRSVDAYLDRQNVPAAVAETLVAAVHENLKPLQRYLGLRKKLLKTKEIRLADLYPPLVPAADTRVGYDEGLKDVLRSLKPLGEKYTTALAGPDMLGRRMIDVFPNKGKESGAFCHSLWGVPPYVMLNYMGEVDDLSTTAHELGHAMHSRINNNALSYPDAGYSSLTGEIASTFNEMLLYKHLLAKYKGDDKTRLYLLGKIVDTIRGTIYRQAMFTEFELKLHGFIEQGTPVTAELLDKTYLDLVKLYYGDGFTAGPNDGVEWSYVPHFYWKHYVFSYACGLASAIALSEKIAAGDTATRDAYLAMLAEPREAAPVEILKKVGVDLTKPDAVRAAARLMDSTVSEMEALAGKLKL